MLLLSHLSLAELRTGKASALPDLAALAAVCRALVVGDRFTPEARRAIDDAAQALQAGGSQPAAVAACAELVAVFEALLASITWRRLQRAQAEAQRAVAATCP